ncbi:MAG: hypothetical protein ACJAZ9_000949 [Neolewinella sp.]|jgi:hypothetical protein
MTMNVKLLLPILFLGFGISPLFAQTISPIGGYEFPAERQGKPLPTVTKMDCGTFDMEAFELVRPGTSETLAVGLDTFGLGGNLTYICNGCATAAFGVAMFANDTLVFAADAGAEEGIEELGFQACNAAGECSDEITISILVQRLGTTVDLGGQAVDPSGTIDVDIPLGNLPSATFCRTVESCSADYPGREQRAFFQFGLEQSNEIRYVAARAAGTDEVCVTLCTELGLCDTYTTSFTIFRPTLNLPFFDDFSYEGFRPDAGLWQDEDVLINRNFPQSPPSIGVATFDAVNFDGLPYENETGGSSTQTRDFLTSSPINLQGESETVLNFYLQPRGLGNRPERQDSFLVQFLDVTGEWRTVFGREGELNTVPNGQEIPFEPVTIPVPVEFQYFGFQFRFTNKSNEQGAVDMWHLDYVKLDNESRTLETNDVAFRDVPGNLLKTYTSMPIRHYQAVGISLLRDSVSLSLFNYSGEANSITTAGVNASKVRITANGAVLEEGNLLAASLFGMPTVDNDNEILAFSAYPRDTVLGSNVFFYAGLVNFINNANVEDVIKLDFTYDLSLNLELPIAPIALSNNIVSSSTYFDEYLAYDDGTAEAVIQVQEGDLILQAYETYVNDELKGVRIRIPRGLGPLGDQDIRLVVYSGDTIPDTLIYEEDFPLLQTEDFFRDSLQGYTTYLFDEVIDLPAGTIFVGWEQLRANRDIGVGFDRNNSPENVQWFNVGNGFQRLTGSTTGAIMIRPLLSGFSDFQTDTDNPGENISRLEVFPNPTNGTLHLRPRQNTQVGNLNYRLFNFAGALLRSGTATNQIELGDFPAGVYLLELTDGAHRERHKIVRH